jgi:hypothetical protein
MASKQRSVELPVHTTFLPKASLFVEIMLNLESFESSIRKREVLLKQVSRDLDGQGVACRYSMIAPLSCYRSQASLCGR